MIDLLLWMLGDVEEAFCYSTNGVLGPDEAVSPDCMLSILRFESGSIAKSMTNMVVQRPPLHHLILYGTEGTLINGEADAFVYRSPAGEPERMVEEPQSAGGTALGKAAGLSHLLDCIERDEEPLVNVSEGARAIAVCDAINRSASTGRPERVEVP